MNSRNTLALYLYYLMLIYFIFKSSSVLRLFKNKHNSVFLKVACLTLAYKEQRIWILLILTTYTSQEFSPSEINKISLKILIIFFTTVHFKKIMFFKNITIVAAILKSWLRFLFVVFFFCKIKLWVETLYILNITLTLWPWFLLEAYIQYGCMGT